MAPKTPVVIIAGILLSTIFVTPADAAEHTFTRDQIRSTEADMATQPVKPGLSLPYEEMRYAELFRSVIDAKASDMVAMTDYLSGSRTTSQEIKADREAQVSAAIRCDVVLLEAAFGKPADRAGRMDCSRMEEAAYDRLERLSWIQRDKERFATTAKAREKSDPAALSLDSFDTMPKTSLTSMIDERNKDIITYQILVGRIKDSLDRR